MLPIDDHPQAAWNLREKPRGSKGTFWDLVIIVESQRVGIQQWRQTWPCFGLGSASQNIENFQLEALRIESGTAHMIKQMFYHWSAALPDSALKVIFHATAACNTHSTPLADDLQDILETSALWMFSRGDSLGLFFSSVQNSPAVMRLWEPF